MKAFLRPNIDRTGRIVRAGLGVLLLAAAVFLRAHLLITMLLVLTALFVFLEAFRGWCALRACGIRTKL